MHQGGTVRYLHLINTRNPTIARLTLNPEPLEDPKPLNVCVSQDPNMRGIIGA